MSTAEHNQYDTVCKGEFKRLLDGQAEMKVMLDDLHTKLFVGNGQPALVTRVYGHSLKLQLLMWIGGTLIVALIFAVVNLEVGR